MRLYAVIINDEVCGQVSIGMTHSETNLVHGVGGTICGIEFGARPVIILQFLEVSNVGSSYRRAVIEEQRLRTFVEVDNEGVVRGVEGHLLGMERQAEEQAPKPHEGESFYSIYR